MRTRRVVLAIGAALAVTVLVGFGVWASTVGPRPGAWGSTRFAPMGPMMGAGSYALPGGGSPVRTLAEARSRAQVFADRLDLRVGEIMQFTNHFYAELLTRSGDGVTEVLVEPRGGAVHLEYGPAMMWNTEYGMHPWSATRPAQVSAAEAQRLAERWLRQRGRTPTVGEPDVFPGYYTLHTLKDGEVSGMLSVNAHSGAVWYHAWHGRFIDMSEPGEAR